LLRLGMMLASQGDFDLSRAVYERAHDLLRRVVHDRAQRQAHPQNLATLYGERRQVRRGAPPLRVSGEINPAVPKLTISASQD
jgi:hypothetical protein